MRPLKPNEPRGINYWLTKPKESKMKKLLKNKWLYVTLLGLAALGLGGAYAEQIGQLILQLVGGGQ